MPPIVAVPVKFNPHEPTLSVRAPFQGIVHPDTVVLAVVPLDLDHAGFLLIPADDAAFHYGRDIHGFR